MLRSVLQGLWVGRRVLAGSEQGLSHLLCVLYLFIHLDSVTRGDRSFLPQGRPGVRKAGSPKTETSEGLE